MSSLWGWAKTAAQNALKGQINFQEGQAPGTINDSAREMMAQIAKFIFDTSGGLVSTGAAGVYSLTTESQITTLTTGTRLAFKANHSNPDGVEPTLNVDGTGAKKLKSIGEGGEETPEENQIAANGIFIVFYDPAGDGGAGSWVISGGTGLAASDKGKELIAKATEAEMRTVLGAASDASVQVVVDALAGKATIAALNALQTQVNNFSGAPIGSTLIWDSPTLPDDYLERNGATLSRTDFSELWAFVNGAGIVKPQASKQHTEWGDGDGSTTFSLPDWRAEHLIGWDNGRGVDAGRGLLTYQADAVKAHNHSAGSYTSPIKRRDAGLNYGQGVLQDGTWAQSLPITGTSGTTGAPTNRVRTVAVMFLVKFR